MHHIGGMYNSLCTATGKPRSRNLKQVQEEEEEEQEEEEEYTTKNPLAVPVYVVQLLLAPSFACESGSSM